MKYQQPEVTLRQIILKDLANNKPELGLKEKTEQVVADTKEILALPEHDQLDALVLVTAAYAHLWGKAFTKDKPQELAAIKIERLLFYRLSKFYNQQQIFEIVELVRQPSRLHSLINN